jgi:tRNA(fMet)-specific endonuclease VapC
MGFLLDTNIVWDLIRHPRGKIFEGIKRVGEAKICTSIVVAAELRFAAARKNSPPLTTQLETILGAIEVLALEAPVDATYRAIRNRLEQAGQRIGGNDLWIAAHALTLGYAVVTDHERAFSKVGGLRVQNWLRSG